MKGMDKIGYWSQLHLYKQCAESVKLRRVLMSYNF